MNFKLYLHLKQKNKGTERDIIAWKKIEIAMVFYSQIFERLPHGISECKKVEGYGLLKPYLMVLSKES